ncbi:MAG TPA: hypothetical protein PKK43_10510 [Spirochaetota bacterium]|nr:hypothetical protein [Spirochaetota bacterium]
MVCISLGCGKGSDVSGGTGAGKGAAEVNDTVFQTRETLFQKTAENRYVIESKKKRGFRMVLNRYQDPLPMMQFDWKGYTVCYYEYYPDTRNGMDLGDIVQIRRKNEVLYDLRGNCYFHGFSYDIDGYIKGDSDPYDVFFRDVTGDGEPELFIHAGSRGAYSYWTMFIFRMTEHGPENILEYYSGRVGVLQTPKEDRKWETHWNDRTWDIMNLGCYVRDIDGDGVPEMIMANSSIEHLLGETHGPYVLTILGWNGTRFMDKTRRFPELARKTALGYVDDGKTDEFLESGEMSLGDPRMPYYANMILAGREKEARKWLRKYGKGEIAEWLDSKKEMRALYDALPTDQAISRMKKRKMYVN